MRRSNKCWFDIPIPLEEVIEAVRDKCDPEAVFDKDELEQWALDNGFVKADE